MTGRCRAASPRARVPAIRSQVGHCRALGVTSACPPVNGLRMSPQAFCALLLATWLTACGAVSSPSNATSASEVRVEPSAWKAADRGDGSRRIVCPDGAASCDIENIVLETYPDGCAEDGFFGTVTDGALFDVPGSAEATPLVRLHGSHFVCALASASARNSRGRLDPPWTYVVVVPVRDFKACQRDAATCAVNPGGTIEWIESTPTAPCQIDAFSGAVSVGCTAGWVEQMGEYGPGAG